MTALLLCSAAALAGGSRDDVARKLEAKISLDLKGAKLAEAIQIFRDVTGLNFVLEDGSELFVRLTVRDVTAKSALRLLLQPTGLGAGYEHGAVVIRDRQALATVTTFRMYDVRSAVRKIQDFPGIEVGLQGRSGLW